jgi:hypothetical protein
MNITGKDVLIKEISAHINNKKLTLINPDWN